MSDQPQPMIGDRSYRRVMRHLPPAERRQVNWSTRLDDPRLDVLLIETGRRVRTTSAINAVATFMVSVIWLVNFDRVPGDLPAPLIWFGLAITFAASIVNAARWWLARQQAARVPDPAALDALRREVERASSRNSD